MAFKIITIVEGFINHNLHIIFKHQTLIQIVKLITRWHSPLIEWNPSLPTPDDLDVDTTQTCREEMPKNAKRYYDLLMDVDKNYIQKEKDRKSF